MPVVWSGVRTWGMLPLLFGLELEESESYKSSIDKTTLLLKIPFRDSYSLKHDDLDKFHRSQWNKQGT